MKRLDTQVVIFVLTASLILLGCGHRRSERWVSPSYSQPLFPVTNFKQAGDKIVRVMNSPTGLCLQVKTSGGFVLDRMISIDDAVRKYPQLNQMFPSSSTNPLDAHFEREIYARLGFDSISGHGANSALTLADGRQVLGSAFKWDWKVTALRDGHAIIYDVVQCHHQVAKNLSTNDLAKLFPELDDLLDYMTRNLNRPQEAQPAARGDGIPPPQP